MLQKLIEKYPEAEITFVSRPFVKDLFSPLRLNFVGADLKGKHKGLLGLFRLFKELNREYKPDVIIDLHGVLRTSILKSFFRMAGKKVFSIDKGREEKKALTRATNKKLVQLQHSASRYAEVFSKAGFELGFDIEDPISLDYNYLENLPSLDTHEKKIGIAPLAFHKGKSWPLSKMEELIDLLLDEGNKILLFGGPNEKEELEKLRKERSEIQNLAGKYNLASEIYLMKHLDMMIAMDSSNMHLASLAGIPVVSIWGATHSFAGFGPLSKNDDLKVELSHEQLDCRPCSVFGNKECFRGDYACLEGVSPEMVKKKVDNVLLNKREK